MSQLDAILHAQPASLPAPPPRREHRRHDYTGYYLKHPRLPDTEPEDPLRALLGAEHFAPDEPPAKAPQWAKTIPEGLHQIRDLAKALNRRPGTIVQWINKGVIPDAPQRGGDTGGWNTGFGERRGYRLWPAAEINCLAQIVKEEGLYDQLHKPWNKTNLKVRARDEIAALRAQSSS